MPVSFGAWLWHHVTAARDTIRDKPIIGLELIIACCNCDYYHGLLGELWRQHANDHCDLQTNKRQVTAADIDQRVSGAGGDPLGASIRWGPFKVHITSTVLLSAFGLTPAKAEVMLDILKLHSQVLLRSIEFWLDREDIGKYDCDNCHIDWPRWTAWNIYD